MFAAVAPGAQLPIAGVRASWSHATTPNDRPGWFLSGAWDGLWWTTVTLRTPGVVRSSVSTWPGTEGTWAEAGQFDVEKLQNGSARVPCPALPPPEVLASAAIELSAPISALVTKRAITSPLMKRKAALGLSRSRRPAMSPAGRLARFTKRRDPGVVNTGPARTRPKTRRKNP